MTSAEIRALQLRVRSFSNHQLLLDAFALEEEDTMPSVSQLVPPFPANLPTASLIVLDFDLLLKKDAQEVEKLYTACHQKGFFYLKNHKVDTDAAFQFGKDLYDIPLAEKEKYAMGDGVNYLGYKRIGEFVVDSKGTPDSQETWNVWP